MIEAGSASRGVTLEANETKLEESQPTRGAGDRVGVFLWLGLVFLIIGLALSGLLAVKEKERLETASHLRFQVVCDAVRHALEDRLKDAAQLLRSGAALFDTVDRVSRSEWRIFSKSLDFETNLSGAQGIGYSELIPRDALAAHEAKIRGEGFPDYRVWPQGGRAQYSSIVYLEPFTGRNLRAFGYDMLSEPVRRAAMEASRDQNRVVLSGKVRLVQETETDVQAGLLMFVPVYRPGLPIDTLEERRKAIFGWVYSPYRMTDFVAASLKGVEDLQATQGIELAVYDGDGSSPGSILYEAVATTKSPSTRAASTQLSLGLDFGESHWTLRFLRPGGLLTPAETRRVWLVFFGGALLSFLFVGLAHSLYRTRQNARLIAERMTARLRESEERYRLLVMAAPEAILLHQAGIFTFVNPAAVALFGAETPEALIGSSVMDRVHPDSRLSAVERLRQASEGGMTLPLLEQKVLRMDGSAVEVEAAGTSLRIDGKTTMQVIMRDIGERKSMERKLRESRENLSAALNASEDSIYLISSDRTLLALNDAAVMILGRSRDDLVGRKAEEVLPAAVVEQRRSVFESAMREGKPMSYEEAADGRLMAHSLYPIFGEEGRVDRLAIYSRDITEKRRAEESVASLLARYQMLLETASDGIHVLDTEGNVVEANAAFCSMLGYSREEVLHLNVADWDRRWSGEGLLAKARELIEKPGVFETTHRRKDGSHFDVEINAVGISLHGRDYLYAAAREITARKNAESALKESEDRYRSLYESALDAILLTAPNGRIIAANKAACRMFGRSEEDILAGGRAGILDLADPRVALALEERRLTGSFYGELTFMRANGEKFPGEVSSNFFIDRRGEERTSMYIRDVTERKATLAALEEALASNKNLLGELQHRVKNSFSLISSLVSLEASETSHEETKILLEELDGRVRSVAQLYSLLYESGSFSQVRLDRYCAEVVAAMASLAGAIGLETRMDYLTIEAKTAAPIGLIVTELVTNSLKYAFPEKRSGRKIVVMLMVKGKEGILEVADNGIGMPSCFDIATDAGTGLVLVQGLARQIGGSFEMKAAETGSRGVLRFPLGNLD
ncbi:MAG TPA: PAS domain S-box protein [Rectinemataceae bacterium]|nr:PAS domain S-box protein [Rectinemataceae bacterium]